MRRAAGSRSTRADISPHPTTPPPPEAVKLRSPYPLELSGEPVSVDERMGMGTTTDSERKPVLLTVDDDPGVSRAVARDLRRQYGDTYRVVRTESGPQALETLRELKLRGDPVAVLLADHRMPDMTGLEFLEEAMDLFPHARRALLTA